MRLLSLMFITAVCVLFVIKLRWPKTKSTYEERHNAESHHTLKDILHRHNLQDNHTSLGSWPRLKVRPRVG